EFPAFSALGFLIYNIVTFGIGEEAGWRGFALPRLQARFSALTATAILFVIWACWHLPLFAYRPGYLGMDIGGIAGWLVSLATGAILLTALFNASRGSILAVALFHASIDVAFTSAGLSPIAINISGALITLAGIAVVVVFRPANLWPEGCMVWTNAGLSFREAAKSAGTRI
ncbi:MAG: CPBP family intramembrane glutamic endopeptidase, partial [Devosia sp.]